MARMKRVPPVAMNGKVPGSTKAQKRPGVFTFGNVCSIRCPDTEGADCQGDALVFVYQDGAAVEPELYTEALCPACGCTWYLAREPEVHWLRL